MNKILYINGDATRPTTEGPNIIVHVCNDIGRWGAGFVVAISKRWPEPERRYREWYQNKSPEEPVFELGAVQFVTVSGGNIVANLIGQRGIKNHRNTSPVRYEAIDAGLGHVAVESSRLQASIHMPRIGCGLAGGTWEKIEPLIIERLIDKGLSVTVYDFAPL